MIVLKNSINIFLSLHSRPFQQDNSLRKGKEKTNEQDTQQQRNILGAFGAPAFPYKITLLHTFKHKLGDFHAEERRENPETT